MPINYRNILVGMVIGVAALPALASSPLSPGADGYYTRAFEMYDHSNFTGAIDQISRYMQTASTVSPSSGDERAQAALLLMKASLMRGDFERVDRLYSDFERLAAGTAYSAQARVIMADALFFKQEYAEAILMYENINLACLPAGEQGDARFRYAVALIHRGYFVRALDELQILSSDPRYSGQSAFYTAYIDYLQYRYEAALKAFSALPPEVSREYGADFYIAQIMYAGGKYDEVIAMEEPLMAAARNINTQDAVAEAYRLLGESNFNRSPMQAVEYLQKYYKMKGDKSARSSLYMLGVMSYDEGDLAQARNYFLPVSSGEDNLAQSANLYLGQIAMRDKDYNGAAIYFDSAARRTADMNVAETALYNYAVASLSGGRVPFGSSTELLEEFAQRFPKSRYAADVDNYLALGYMAEHRYDKALERFERIKKPSAEVRKSMQICLYDLGCSAVADKNYQEAEQYLRRAVNLNSDAAVTAQANLWLGDALYAAGKDAAAISAYKGYISHASKDDGNRGVALYNQAYAAMRKGDYKEAKQLFGEALSQKGAAKLTYALARDARLRQADCDNYAGNISGALSLYEQAAAEGNAESDYAAFQAACMQGVSGNQARKAVDLEAMMKRWPDSEWTGAALYELVQARIATGDLAGAQQACKRLEALRPDSEQLREAMVALAGACSAAGKSDEAIAECKDIITRWPSSKQARTASEYLQSLYSRKGQMNEYLSFISSVPGAPKPSPDDMDRLSYFAAAEALEDSSDVMAMEDYLKNFPSGAYVADASLALAQIYSEALNTSRAEELLDNIINRYPDSDAAPEAMLLQAEIIGNKGQETEAAALYQQVLRKAGSSYTPRAYLGLIKVTADPQSRLSYIDRFLALPALDEDSRSEATRLKAQTLADTGDFASAEALLLPLSANSYSVPGAQATITLANIYVQQNKPTKAVELLNRFTAAGCEDNHWLARGYIALADAYAAAGSKSKARSYIKALEDNYTEPDSEIHVLINDRLSKY